MPIIKCSENKAPGYKWGSRGKCYVYTAGNEASSKAAHAKAVKQGAAAHAAGYRG